MTYICEFDSPIGKILIAEKNGAVTGVWFEGQKFFPDFKESEALFSESNPVLIQAKSWLYRYFSGERPEISELTLSPKGSDFRKEVWKELCKIPYGSTVTYVELAQLLAAPLGKIFVGYDAELFEITRHAFKLFSFSFILAGFNVFFIIIFYRSQQRGCFRGNIFFKNTCFSNAFRIDSSLFFRFGRNLVGNKRSGDFCILHICDFPVCKKKKIPLLTLFYNSF